MAFGPSRGGVALTTFIPGDNGNGGGNGTPIDATLIDTIASETIPTHPTNGRGMQANAEVQAAMVLRRALKGGNINQGYAQCDVDRLAIAVEKGECPIERIQCRQMATLRTLALAGGATVTFTITPVGPSFAREMLTVFARPDDVALIDFVPIVTQIASKGRFAEASVVASTVAASNVPGGFPLAAHNPAFQNYVLSSGIVFSSSNPLVVTVVNFGADAGSFLAGITFDQVRAG